MPFETKRFTNAGDTVMLDIGDEAFSAFGLKNGSPFRFTKSRYQGKTATAIGVCNDGMLWFVLESAPVGEDELPQVMTTSCRVREEYIRRYGLQLLDE